MAPVTQGEPWLAQGARPRGASASWWKKYPVANPAPPSKKAMPNLSIYRRANAANNTPIMEPKPPVSHGLEVAGQAEPTQRVR